MREGGGRKQNDAKKEEKDWRRRRSSGRGKKMGEETGWAGAWEVCEGLQLWRGGKAVRGPRAWERSLSVTVGTFARVRAAGRRVCTRHVPGRGSEEVMVSE